MLPAGGDARCEREAGRASANPPARAPRRRSQALLATAHALDHVLYRRHRTGDDVHLHFQADAAHADGLAHVFLVVDDEFLRNRMQQLLIGGNIHCARSFDRPCYISRRDFLVFDCDHAARVEAADVAAGDTDPDIAYLTVGHQLGFFQCPLY